MPLVKFLASSQDALILRFALSGQDRGALSTPKREGPAMRYILITTGSESITLGCEVDVITNINWLLQTYCEKELDCVIVNLLGNNYTCDSPGKEVLTKGL